MKPDIKKVKIIHPFFTKINQPVSTTSNLLTWEEKHEQSLLIGYYKFNKEIKSNSILAFDLDSTLIKVKGNHVHAKDEFDWEFLIKDIKQKIKERLKEDQLMVIFSNQNGLEPEKMKKNDKRKIQFKNKLNAFTSQLNIPMIILAATKKDQYRKPLIGMWNVLCEILNYEPDKNQSSYIGDAAGRKKQGKLANRKDFADTDRKFALNLNLDFFTPEEYFLNIQKEEFNLTGFNPKQYIKNIEHIKKVEFKKKYELEVILLVGLPGSGKSHFYHNITKPLGYERINMDTLKTSKKCTTKLEELLTNAKSAVIDNTNLDIKSRELYITKAKEHKAKIRVILFNMNIDICYHNNLFRAYHPTDKDEIRTPVPKMVYDISLKKYQEPTLSEGIDEIQKWPFIPLYLDSEIEICNKQRTHYKKYWELFYF
ncbi:PNK3P-domain-containing protein [Neoconidiobolus thromboides FSU 785]|nr:PNK3P-domain-containing protein [Neoconidiobolus thromboides FSU 785]